MERNSLWSGDDVKKSDGGSDSGIKMEPGSKWRRNPSDVSDESDKSTSGKKNPVISQTGSWRRGMTAQVGITMPRTKPAAPAGTLKTPGTGESEACVGTCHFQNLNRSHSSEGLMIFLNPYKMHRYFFLGFRLCS